MSVTEPEGVGEGPGAATEKCEARGDAAVAPRGTREPGVIELRQPLGGPVASLIVGYEMRDKADEARAGRGRATSG
jgi:hypothetical protein